MSVANEIPAIDQSQIIPDAMKKRGVEFLLGMDIPRAWATAAQVFINPEFAMLVFREQTFVNGDVAPEMVMKNSASVVIPVSVVRDLHRIIGEQLALIDAQATQ